MNLKEFHQNLLKSKEYVDASNELKLQFDLANSVLRARINLGWTQEELAEKIGTKQANISKIEAGLANPTLNVIQKLSNCLGINVSFSCEPNEEPVFYLSTTTDKTVSKEFSTMVDDLAEYHFATDSKIYEKVMVNA